MLRSIGPVLLVLTAPASADAVRPPVRYEQTMTCPTSDNRWTYTRDTRSYRDDEWLGHVKVVIAHASNDGTLSPLSIKSHARFPTSPIWRTSIDLTVAEAAEFAQSASDEDKLWVRRTLGQVKGEMEEKCSGAKLSGYEFADSW